MSFSCGRALFSYRGGEGLGIIVPRVCSCLVVHSSCERAVCSARRPSRIAEVRLLWKRGGEGRSYHLNDRYIIRSGSNGSGSGIGSSSSAAHQLSTNTFYLVADRTKVYSLKTMTMHDTGTNSPRP